MIAVVCCKLPFPPDVKEAFRSVDNAAVLKWLGAAIPPLTFLLLLWIHLEPRTSRRTALWAAAGFLTAELALQGAILALGDSPELVFTLLPLTGSLPAIVCLHLLSKNRFLPTALTWLLALLCEDLLLALQKLLVFFLAGLAGPAWEWLSCGGVALAAGALLWACRAIREPFLACAREAAGGWPVLLFLPAMLLALYSYFLSSTTNVVVLLLLFLTALASFFVLARLFVSLTEERLARDARLQMKALRQDYEVLRKKLDLGRSYRHDMRHHLTALSALLQEGDCAEAKRYVAEWQGQLTQIEGESWCRNSAVNGVLSAYLKQARDAGCTTQVEVSLPEGSPFEEVDLCVVLANALENAIQACEKLPEGAPRQIELSMVLTDRRRLTLRVENSCGGDVAFDSAGFPVAPHREGHGQGLRSIAAVAEKYHGLFRCDCKDGRFILQVVLLHAAPERRRARWLLAACAGAFLCLFLLNCMPSLTQALENIPVLGQTVRVVDLHAYSLGWGDSGISARDPALEGDGPAVDELNARKNDFIQRMEARFIEYAARKYQGYVAEDIAYETVRDDERLFILRLTATLNAGGSVDESRYIVLDKETGQVLELADLFQPEADYIFPISREITAQMAEQMNAGQADYFLPGGIWSDEECFRSIQPDQDFYIDENGQLVIAFAEYEVAPGSMGEPEFVIPTDALDGLLAQPSLLR